MVRRWYEAGTVIMRKKGEAKASPFTLLPRRAAYYRFTKRRVRMPPAVSVRCSR